MTNAHSYTDDWEEALAEDDDPVRRLITSRSPKLESAQQFGLFVALILDEFEAGAAKSWMGAVIDRLKVGAQIDVSRRPYRAPSSPVTYHIGWIRRVVRRANATVQDNIGDRQTTAKEVMRIWIEKDVSRRTQRQIAEYHGVAKATVDDRVRLGRGAIYSELVAAGRAEPAPR